MQVNIVCAPDYAMAEVDLAQNEQIQVEAGSMVAMTANMQIQTKAKGGVLSGLKRMVGGESFFMNTYTAAGAPGRIMIAPGAPGDMRHIQLNGEFFIQSGSYIASSPSINIDTKWGGAKTFFGGEGLFILKASGQGDVLFGTFGAVHEVEVNGSYTVDTGHIVAFEPTLTFNIRRIGGLKSLFLSGEGLVCDFQGKGKLYLQTRKPASFVHWIHWFRPVRKSNN
ncbi:MAG TPA: TIGR00266 family protein [bacterium]|nr:TIGR00266 family protein [bacterium]